MTAIIGKYQIHLGWEAFLGLLVFTIATAFTIGIKTDQLLDRLDKIEASQQTQNRRDTSIENQVRVNTYAVGQLKPDVVSLKTDVIVIKEQLHFGYITETRDSKGHIKQHAYSNNK